MANILTSTTIQPVSGGDYVIGDGSMNISASNAANRTAIQLQAMMVQIQAHHNGNLTHDGNFTVNGYVAATITGTAVTGISTTNGNGVVGSSASGHGVYGLCNSGHAVFGSSTFQYGVAGYSASNIGIYGNSGISYGVYGISASSYGVYGSSTGSYGVVGFSANSAGTVGLSTNSVGIQGSSSTSYGVYGISGSNIGIYGSAFASAGVYGISYSTNGVQGVSTTAAGVYGSSPTNGVQGVSTGGWGVYGLSTGSVGVLGSSASSYGVQGTSTVSYGVQGQSASSIGIYGSSYASYGVYGTSLNSHGVVGFSASYRGVFGSSTDNVGVYGSSVNNHGVVGITAVSLNLNDHDAGAGVYAGYFSGGGGIFVNGSCQITGALTKGSGTFLIDHPSDPENMYLRHSFVESPDMKNIYDDVVTLDETGKKSINLPSWFSDLNDTFRYQLTAIGKQETPYILQEINENMFIIAGDPNAKVSWQVTGVRKDAFAKANPVYVEDYKSEKEKGKYLHPTAFGKSEDLAIHKS